jgi:ketoreductase
VQQQSGKSRDEAAATMLRDVPRGRPIPPEDVAETVVFLLSNPARRINGMALAVDGAWRQLSRGCGASYLLTLID